MNGLTIDGIREALNDREDAEHKVKGAKLALDTAKFELDTAKRLLARMREQDPATYDEAVAAIEKARSTKKAAASEDASDGE